MSCICNQMAGSDIKVSPTCIGSHWIFKNLAPDEKNALFAKISRKIFAKYQAVFLQGDPADEMFLIKGGRVKLSKVFEDGKEVTLDIRKSGDFVGETMFADEGEYPVSAYCMEDTLICGFSRGDFEELVLNHPQVGLQVIKTLSERISRLTSRIGNLSLTNIEERLFRVLSNVAKEHGVKQTEGITIQFPLTHQDLSFLTGAHRVSITKAMKTLMTTGRIFKKGKTLFIPYQTIA